MTASPLTGNPHIISANERAGATGLASAYQQARTGDPITYTISQRNTLSSMTRPAATFTSDMWWQNYGLALLAGISWLLVGGFLLATATEWTGAVEGITLLPAAMLLLLYSHWGNVQQPYSPDLVVQLLWIPAFALLGAALIHLSLTYRPATLSRPRTARLTIDGLPYLPLLALLAYEWSSLLITGHVPTRINVLLSLGYAIVCGIISSCIGIYSLLHIWSVLSSRRHNRRTTTSYAIPTHIFQRAATLLMLWIIGIGSCFCLGILPILLTGQPLLSLPTLSILAIIYPLILVYVIRSQRQIDRLHLALVQREEALSEQQKVAEGLRQAKGELRQVTSLLLHADAHLRATLSQRIHDQPKQQALRIRSLLGHWQHKLRIEAEQDPQGKVVVQPLIEALGKVRKISEELEGDLRGLQLLLEDAYQRRSLGLKLHLEKLIREDLPTLHPESPLHIQADLWALDTLSPDLEHTDEGEKIAEAISYTVTQALLNIYNHAGATFATVRILRTHGALEVYIIDDGRGFDTNSISVEKTSLFKATLKAREAGGTLTVTSVPRPQAEHGTTIVLSIPLPYVEDTPTSGPLMEARTPGNVAH